MPKGNKLIAKTKRNNAPAKICFAWDKLHLKIFSYFATADSSNQSIHRQTFPTGIFMPLGKNLDASIGVSV